MVRDDGARRGEGVTAFGFFAYLSLLLSAVIACSESSRPRVHSGDGVGATGGTAGGSGGVAGMGAAGSGGMASLKRFQSATPLVREASWYPSTPIIVEGINGDIEVVRGSGNAIVRAVFTPFVFRLVDTPESEVMADFERLVTEASEMSGALLVRSSRVEPAPSTLGADIVVEIPPVFDGKLSIRQSNGRTEVSFAGNASGIELSSVNGMCQVACSAVATALSLRCDDGDLAVDVPGAPPGSDARTIRTGLGNIAVSFASIPVTEPFSVHATASDGVVEITGGAACQLQNVSPGVKAVSCHGATSADPVYQVNAQSLSDITLTF